MSKKTDSQPESKSNKNTIKEIIEIVIFLGLAVLLVFSFNWILAAALNTDIPLVVVTSESMEPTYLGHSGEFDVRKDMLVVRGVDPSEIKVGDTIVFYRHEITNESEIDYEREPIVHRVNFVYYDSAEEEYWFTTQGDNNNDYVFGDGVNEQKIHESRLIGKIVGRIKYLGGIINYFKTTTGKIVLVTIIAVIMVLTWLLSSIGDKKEDDPFEKKDEVEEKTDPDNDPTFWDKLKSFAKKVNKRKHIVYPALILGIIVFIPIVDTLAADWDLHYGVQEVVYDGARNFNLESGNQTYIYADVTISCPGHWHQSFRSFNLKVINATTGELLGENNWTVVYNFEGSLTVNSGVWIDGADTFVGASYNLTVTANLRSKFGRTSVDIFNLPFNLIMR